MSGISRRNRWVAIGVAGSLAVLGLEVVDPSATSAAVTSASVSYNCDGATGDGADTGTGTDSKTLLGAIGALPPLAVAITIDAPDKLKAKSGNFTVKADATINLPPSVTDLARNTLKLTKLNVVAASYALRVNGPTSTELLGTIPDREVDLGGGNLQISGSVSGTLSTEKSGLYRYSPGDLRFGVRLNASVSGLSIKTVTIVCSASGTLASTSVQVPGAPIPPSTDPIGYTFSRSLAALPVIGAGVVTPDNGNPIVSDSLKIDGAPSGGLAAVWQGQVLFYSDTPGLYNVPVQICGESMLQPLVPGKDEVQTLTWDKLSYAGNDLNAHPLGMSLTFGGKETAIIPLSYWDPIGFGALPTPVIGANPFDLFGSQFVRPSPAAIEAALEALPNVGSGNVNVAASAKGYTITFTGKLARTDVPAIELGQWFTWLDQDTKKGVDDIIKGLTGGGASTANAAAAAAVAPAVTTPAPTETWDSLNGKLLLGQISFEQWQAGATKLLTAQLVGSIPVPEALALVGRIFPAKPSFANPTAGEPDIPARMTGPLCTTFNASFAVFEAPVQVQGTTQVRESSPSGCTTRTVKVRSRGKTRYVKRTVCPKKKATTKKKKSTRRR